MGFEDLIRRAAFAAAAADSDKADPHPIDPRAQAMELRDRYRRAMEPAEFKPGMLCREKRGMGTFKHTPTLLVFWRWLDPEVLTDRIMLQAHNSKHYTSGVDCVLSFLDRDGDLVSLAHESWRIEPCDAEFPINAD